MFLCVNDIHRVFLKNTLHSADWSSGQDLQFVDDLKSIIQIEENVEKV